MPRKMLVAAAVALSVLLLTGRAAADPSVPEPVDACSLMPVGGCLLEVKSPSTTDGGTRLPPGFFMDRPTFERIDKEHKRLQDQETRLLAEKKVLLKRAKPPWLWVAGAVVLGVGIGYAISR